MWQVSKSGTPSTIWDILEYFTHSASTREKTNPLVKLSIVGGLRDREVACLASDLQGLNFGSCVWRAVSSSRHPQEVLLAQFSMYVHKSGLKPDSFIYFQPGNK